MRRCRAVAVGMGVVMSVAMGVRMGHKLCYNITLPKSMASAGYRSQGFPIAIAMAAARNGNGSDTAARNQTNRAGMNGISHSNTR
jgi:hypothetical protein